MSRFAEFILNHPKSILISLILLTIAAIYPALQVETDFSVEGFFPVGDKNIEQYQEVTDEFGHDDNTIIIALTNQDLFSAETLRFIDTLSTQLTSIEHVKEVRSITNVENISNRNDMLEVTPYLDGDYELINADSVKQLMLDDPFLKGTILSPDGNTTLIAVSIEPEKNEYATRQQIINNIDQVLEPWLAEYDLKVNGIPYFRNQYVNLLNAEILYYISISSILIIALLWFLFRNILGVLIPMVIVWLTILYTTAVLAMTGGVFEILSSTIAPILLCVGIADSVHLLTKYNDARLKGLDNRASLKETIIVLGSATLLTSITTAIGFGTLITSNVIPMQRFGIYTAAGVLLAFFITIFLLPAILMVTKNKANTGKIKTDAFLYIGRFLRRVHRISEKYPKRIVILSLLFTAAAGFGIIHIKVNSFVFDDVGRNSTVLENSRYIGEQVGPQFPLELVIDTGTENGITDPAFLQKLDSLDYFLTEFPEIGKSVSFATLMKQIHEVMNPEAAEINSLPNNQQLAAQYLFLFELTGNDGLDAIADFNYQKVRISAQTEDAGSHRMNQIRHDINNYLEYHFPDMEHIITGTTMLVAGLTSNIVTSLAYSIILAFLFISLLMAYLFRNLKLVLISLLPNMIPLIITAGIMGYFGIDIKPSTAVIFTIAFGIAVDDSIHFLARFRIEIMRGNTLVNAVRITTERTGRAIILTSAILLVGFGVLGTSQFQSTQFMGLLTCLTIFNALLADLLFLPALIHWMKPEINIANSVD